MKKVILAYSGGLDTSVIIPWLKENYGYQVIAVAVNVGQGEEVVPLKEKALQTGASKMYIEDARREFVTDYIFPTLKAGAVYEGKYLLGTAFARPLIAKRLVKIARQEKAAAIAHGCTGKGNDQVRFELAIKALAPEMTIIAPWRIWEIKSREEQIAYAEARQIPVPVSRERPYSMDRNLWHLSHEGADLEDPGLEPAPDLLNIITPPEKAPDQPTYLELTFEKGIPVALNGEVLEEVQLIEKLNQIAAINGVGIVDLVENRLVGIKSRGVYETPAGTVLYQAHQELESLTLDRLTAHYKTLVAQQYAQLVYDGLWFHPLRKALDTFVNVTQETVSGTVKLKLYKGNCFPAGVQSPYSLYREDLATFGKDEVYNQQDAAGFINLFGLPLKVRALMKQQLQWEVEK